ncbi:Kha1 protein [Saccharomycopsis crataegensis]|uniref:Kha1 protein n=1 Tax=Saccharomycopsis crataegensis TaxID=43959 RepID=A0AAV5QP82_9ASCO|nr:Kha1 protein [Saccharomycopsis crataegensis]
MAVNTTTFGGITSGRNPVVYSSSSPYTIFLLQALIVYFFSSLLNYPLQKLKQPRVIGEVIAGIILGPSVFGKIPHFTEKIFPKASIPGFTLVANIGIILFLFVIGLDVDLVFMKKNLKAALSVGIANMALPFALGCAISVGIYHEYRENDESLPHIKFTTYMVFVATAVCITALPVLARILRELGLQQDRVGTIVLSAGIFNDLVGWILLALSVTLANADNSVNVVYILLLTAGWFLTILFPIKYLLHKYLKNWTNEVREGPNHTTLTLVFGLVFISAFFTDIIGVHPIFGAFMVGLIIPRDYGFVEKFVEKIDGLISAVFIPLYFALAGQSVDLGKLNSGKDWGYIIGLCSLAFIGKVIGGLFASKATGLYWRESLAVGVLMSCKGIVEIVVITVGLSAQILNEKTYSMFIVMALVTTFLTTPLTRLVYTDSYRESILAEQVSDKKKHERTSSSSVSNNDSMDISPEEIVREASTENITPPESPTKTNQDKTTEP